MLVSLGVLKGTQELLNFVFCQVFVRLGVFRQFRAIIDVGVGQRKAAGTPGNVCFDVGDTVNLFQIASDRGGAATSEHVRNFERH